MFKQVFTIEVLSQSLDELEGARIAVVECHSLIAEHVDTCILGTSEIASVGIQQ